MRINVIPRKNAIGYRLKEEDSFECIEEKIIKDDQ